MRSVVRLRTSVVVVSSGFWQGFSHVLTDVSQTAGLAAGAEAGLATHVASGETGGKLRHSSDRNEISFFVFLCFFGDDFQEPGFLTKRTEWKGPPRRTACLLGIKTKR